MTYSATIAVFGGRTYGFVRPDHNPEDLRPHLPPEPPCARPGRVGGGPAGHRPASSSPEVLRPAGRGRSIARRHADAVVDIDQEGRPINMTIKQRSPRDQAHRRAPVRHRSCTASYCVVDRDGREVKGLSVSRHGQCRARWLNVAAASTARPA